ncbi:MAG TPA: hypothetical protein VF522_03960 [Ramlibacter sp.]|uniref:hypothetical protein n=1 Tax=Ramlibacter sp. TaxID=1917967 RepID=UPI002ED51751
MAHKNSLQLLVLSAAVVVASFLWQGSAGLNLWDEGYLWYGAQRVMLGEVPIRDFMAYDPGRYYWSAAFMSAWGDNGIMALRSAVAIFQAIGLFVGLLLISRASDPDGKPDRPYLLVAASVLALWMFPRHKLFDISLSILLIGVLAFLVRKPTRRRYFVAGLCVGFIAVFGRNHGMYGSVGSIAAIAWLGIRRTSGPVAYEGLAFWLAGVGVGFAPIVLMAWLIPGFGSAFWESIRFLFDIRFQMLPIPVPWPWRVDPSVRSGDGIRAVLVGLFFVGTLVFGVLSVLWAVRQKLQSQRISPVLVAASVLALPYAHHAFSRADVGHLAQGIFPLLVGGLAVLATQPATVKWPAALVLCAASFWVMHGFHPGWQCRTSTHCVDVEVSGDRLRVDPSTAGDIALLRNLAEKYAPDGKGFIVTPYWPGAYALLERKSPAWEIYALFPRSEEFEREEIDRLKTSDLGFAFVLDLPLDGRDDLRFGNTHPLLHRYLLDRFEALPGSPNPAYRIFKAREDARDKPKWQASGSPEPTHAAP